MTGFLGGIRDAWAGVFFVGVQRTTQTAWTFLTLQRELVRIIPNTSFPIPDY